MRDIDAEVAQDKGFKVGGEEFQPIFVRPEVLAVWEDEPIDEKSADLLKKQDERIKSFLTEEDQKRWDEIRARDNGNAVPMVAVNEVLRHLIEVNTARPTSTPSPSGAGRGKSAATS